MPVQVLSVIYHAGKLGESFSVGLDVLPLNPDDSFGLFAKYYLEGSFVVEEEIGEGGVSLSPARNSAYIYFEPYYDSVNFEPQNIVIVGFRNDGDFDVNTESDSIPVVTINDIDADQSENEQQCKCTCTCATTGNNTPRTQPNRNTGGALVRKPSGCTQQAV